MNSPFDFTQLGNSLGAQVPQQQNPAFNMRDLIALFQQGQTQQAKIQGQNQAQAQQGRLQAQREALTPQHLGMSGGVINPTTGVEAGDPFSNGFFQNAGQRAATETSRLGHPGASSASPSQAVDPNILMPGSQFSFMPPDNTFDQTVTAPGLSPTSPNFQQNSIDRTQAAMAALARQRQPAPRNPFAF